MWIAAFTRGVGRSLLGANHCRYLPTFLSHPKFDRLFSTHDGELMVLPLPKLSPSMTEGTIRWLKAPGEVVQEYDLVLEVATDSLTEGPYKVGAFAGTVELLVEAAEEGFLGPHLQPEGATLPVGTPIAVVYGSAAEAAAAVRAHAGGRGSGGDSKQPRQQGGGTGGAGGDSSSGGGGGGSNPLPAGWNAYGSPHGQQQQGGQGDGAAGAATAAAGGGHHQHGFKLFPWQSYLKEGGAGEGGGCACG